MGCQFFGVFDAFVEVFCGRAQCQFWVDFEFVRDIDGGEQYVVDFVELLFVVGCGFQFLQFVGYFVVGYVVEVEVC